MLEKLKSTLDKSIATVSVKSEVLVENSKIKSQIQNLEREHASLIQKLGETMYGMWCSNSFNRDTFQQMCEAIRACETGIMEQNRRLEQIKQEEQQILGAQGFQQPSQSYHQQPQAQTYQQQQPQQAAYQAPAATAPGVVCSCGNINPAGARFCTKCGKQFS